MMTGERGAREAERTGGALRAVGTGALLLLIVGGINWGVLGLTGVDLVAWAFGPLSTASRVVYGVVGIAALYCLVMLPRWSRVG